MGTKKMMISGLDEGFSAINENETPDNFVVDIQSLSNGTDKDANSNSRITVKLQRNLSRKGSQRGERITTTLASGGVASDGTSSNGFHHIGECNTVEKSTVAPPTSPLVGMGTTTEAVKIIAESSRCRRYVKHRSCAWMVDPKRVLFFFATLSSMGTMILIYFTLSMAKISSGDDISQAQ